MDAPIKSCFLPAKMGRGEGDKVDGLHTACGWQAARGVLPKAWGACCVYVCVYVCVERRGALKTVYPAMLTETSLKQQLWPPSRNPSERRGTTSQNLLSQDGCVKKPSPVSFPTA